MLEVEGLKLYYKTLKGYVKAVDDVSFTVNDGELLGLAGGIWVWQIYTGKWSNLVVSHR